VFAVCSGGFVIALKINRFHSTRHCTSAGGSLPAGEHCTTAILITIVTTSEQSRWDARARSAAQHVVQELRSVVVSRHEFCDHGT
jgi:hypothetical protein